MKNRIWFISLLALIYCSTFSAVYFSKLDGIDDSYFNLSGNQKEADPTFYFRNYSNSPFLSLLPEKVNLIGNPLIKRVLNSYCGGDGLAKMDKNAFYLFSSRYQSNNRYICLKLKKAVLLFPFHFFF
ncbi:MAG: hypothetical protein U0W24_10745 [Bacteroidales bacterium]